MAPDGYSIPDYQDYRFFTWNENANLGYGPDGFNNLLGQRITYTITPREAVVGGVEYGPVHIYDFVYEGAHWVMAGFGHQYNATDIAPMSLLFATSGTGGKTWCSKATASLTDGATGSNTVRRMPRRRA